MFLLLLPVSVAALLPNPNTLVLLLSPVGVTMPVVVPTSGAVTTSVTPAVPRVGLMGKRFDALPDCFYDYLII